MYKHVYLHKLKRLNGKYNKTQDVPITQIYKTGVVPDKTHSEKNMQAIGCWRLYV